MEDFLWTVALWTVVVWSLIFGSAAAQVVWYLLARSEYREASRAGARELGARSVRGLSHTVPPGTSKGYQTGRDISR